MSLLQDIQAERDATADVIRSFAQMMFAEMRDAIKSDQVCRPVVLGMIGDQTELHFPTWNSPREKDAAFASISDGLQERQATGAICAFSATVSQDAKSPEQALVVMVHTLDWKKMLVQPYSITDTRVVWKEPYIADSFDTPLIEISCAN